MDDVERTVGERALLTMEVLMLFLCATGLLAMKVFHAVGEPYMDEIFHIPQAQNYCEGHYSHWDPMITTLPGLYYTSVAVAKPLNWLFDVPMTLTCSVPWLRSVNVVYALGNFVMLLCISKKIHSKEQDYDSGKALLNALALAIFPVLYFFSFLYYTDPGSTFFVLLTYLISLYDLHILASLTGIAAIFFRQTNIVWVVFVAGLAAAKCIRNSLQFGKKDFTDEQTSSPQFLLVIARQLLLMLKSNKKSLFLLVKDIIQTCFPYILVGVGFIAFVIWNGSIVVGAKDDHPAGLHFPQLFYFASFTCAFSYMHLISLSSIKDFLKFALKRPLLVISLCGVCILLVWKFTIIHKYILADNRHYTFYVWSKIYSRHHLVRYILCPGYVFAGWLLFKALDNRDILWKTVYLITITINLVPMTLIEFRYFILPYIVFRLNIKQPPYLLLICEICVYFCINSGTLYLFMERPFQWPSEIGMQRFMW